MSEPSVCGKMGTGKGRKGPRPKLSIPYTKLDIYCEFVAALALAGLAAYLFATWTKLPAQIPVHFDIMGQPDRWAGRNSIFTTFGIMIALYAGLTIIQRFPHVYNYPFGLTPQNVHRQYQLARQFLALIKTEIICFFTCVQWGIMNMAQGRFRTLGLWLALVLIAALLGAFIQYFIRAKKAN
jgi:hypothetical protein